MKNANLHSAKAQKNDEFYTQYMDIQEEVNAYTDYDKDVFRDKVVLCPCDDPEWSNFTKFFAQNFKRFGLKKLISTSYCGKSISKEPTLFEMANPDFDEDKSKTHGKIFIVDGDYNGDGKIDINDLHYEYLDGDGDFHSEEVTRLRDEADIIVTNPPFSIWDEFILWVMEANKKFLAIGNKNVITYKDIFPLIKDNKMWVGHKQMSGSMFFTTPDSTDVKSNRIACCWFTNLEHGKCHSPLDYMTMDDNLRFSKHKEIRERGYPKYDNYDAIEVSYSDAIPKGYDGVMGVPISFLDKYCPEQFEIVGIMSGAQGNGFVIGNDGRLKFYVDNKSVYARILIRFK